MQRAVVRIVNTVMVSLLVPQVLLYFNRWFSSCFFALAICTYAYKAWSYHYPAGALELEVRLENESLEYFNTKILSCESDFGSTTTYCL